MKQRKASSGVGTMGSPRTLKLFNEYGPTGLTLEGRQLGMEARVGLGANDLHARGVIDMRQCGTRLSL
jgi:hypothetical protein